MGKLTKLFISNWTCSALLKHYSIGLLLIQNPFHFLSTKSLFVLLIKKIATGIFAAVIYLYIFFPNLFRTMLPRRNILVGYNLK